MNTSPTSPTTPNLELLRKAIREYQPDPSRIPFSNLKPFHDSIVELRGKNASYAAIAELLNNMASRPAGRVWPNTAASSWKAAKNANGANGREPAPAANAPATPQSAPAVAAKPTPATPAPTTRFGGQCPAATKRRFSIPFTRTAHRQRENDDSKRTGRIRGQPEIETASELTQPGKQSGDAPASPRCPARQPERLISRPATTASHTQPQRFGRRPDKPVTPP
jgi:hypothetical protein